MTDRRSSGRVGAMDDQAICGVAMLTDHHAHWLPPALLTALVARDDPPLARQDGADWTFTAALRPRHLPVHAYDLQARDALLARLGIDRQMLSLSPLWNIDRQPLDVALPLVRLFNDATIAAAQTGHRYGAFAAVPTVDVAAACRDLIRVGETGAAAGVVLPACELTTRTRADRWAPLFAIAAERRLRVFVHPGFDGSPPAAASSTMTAVASARVFGVEPQHQLGLAMLTLCHEGWLDDYPGLEVQFANLGGSFPFLLERLHRMVQDDGRDDRDHQARRNILVDSASLGPAAIDCARRMLGASRVVFGTDMPLFDAQCAVDTWRAEPVESTQADHPNPSRSGGEAITGQAEKFTGRPADQTQDVRRG